MTNTDKQTNREMKNEAILKTSLLTEKWKTNLQNLEKSGSVPSSSPLFKMNSTSNSNQNNITDKIDGRLGNTKHRGITKKSLSIVYREGLMNERKKMESDTLGAYTLNLRGDKKRVCQDEWFEGGVIKPKKLTKDAGDQGSAGEINWGKYEARCAKQKGVNRCHSLCWSREDQASIRCDKQGVVETVQKINGKRRIVMCCKVCHRGQNIMTVKCPSVEFGEGNRWGWFDDPETWNDTNSRGLTGKALVKYKTEEGFETPAKINAFVASELEKVRQEMLEADTESDDESESDSEEEFEILPSFEKLIHTKDEGLVWTEKKEELSTVDKPTLVSPSTSDYECFSSGSDIETPFTPPTPTPHTPPPPTPVNWMEYRVPGVEKILMGQEDHDAQLEWHQVEAYNMIVSRRVSKKFLQEHHEARHTYEMEKEDHDAPEEVKEEEEEEEEEEHINRSIYGEDTSWHNVIREVNGKNFIWERRGLGARQGCWVLAREE